jgi:hypothetical protein
MLHRGASVYNCTKFCCLVKHLDGPSRKKKKIHTHAHTHTSMVGGRETNEQLCQVNGLTIPCNSSGHTLVLVKGVDIAALTCRVSWADQDYNILPRASHMPPANQTSRAHAATGLIIQQPKRMTRGKGYSLPDTSREMLYRVTHVRSGLSRPFAAHLGCILRSTPDIYLFLRRQREARNKDVYLHTRSALTRPCSGHVAHVVFHVFISSSRSRLNFAMEKLRRQCPCRGE